MNASIKSSNKTLRKTFALLAFKLKPRLTLKPSLVLGLWLCVFSVLLVFPSKQIYAQQANNNSKATQKTTQKILFKITGFNTELDKPLDRDKTKAIVDNINERLAILRKSYPDQLDQLTVDDLAQQGIKEVELAMQPYGYFHPVITDKVITHKKYSLITQKHAQQWQINYQITLGPPVLTTKVDIQITGPGKNNHKLNRFKENNPLKLHHNFTSEAYNRTQEILFNIAHNQGYMQSQLITHVITIDLAQNSAEIVLALDTGPRFYYGNINFTKTPYSIDFLKRFILFKPGQVYSPNALQELQQDLTNTKYFSNVMVTPELKNAEDKTASDNSVKKQVPITIKTQPVKSQQYKLGLGYGTNTGIRTSFGVDLFRITNTGQHLSAIANISQVNTGVTLKYYIPGNNPIIDQYTIGGYMGAFKPDAGDAYSKKLSTGYDTHLSDHWQSSVNMNYLHERFEINGSPYESVDLVYPSVYLSRLAANNPLNPTSGTRFGIETSAGTIPSDINFAKYDLDGKLIYPTSENNFLLLRGNFGAIYAQNFAAQFPLSMRFFAGGVNSIRGYSYQSIGPGKFEKIISAEFQQRVSGDFYTGVFVDEGTASDNINQSLERGIGISLIYRTSVGPVNFNIAQANTDPDKPMRIEFSFGG